MLSSATLEFVESSVHHVSEYVDIIMAAPKGKSAGETPLIIFPHGGPNYAYYSSFSVMSAIAVSYGYAIAAGMHNKNSWFIQSLFM